MLETSKDVLNIVIAISVFGLSFFIAWAIYYLAMIMRQAYKAVKGVRAKIDLIDETIKVLKEKIENSTSYLLLIGEGVKKLVDVMKSRKEEATTTEKEKNKEVTEKKYKQSKEKNNL